MKPSHIALALLLCFGGAGPTLAQEGPGVPTEDDATTAGDADAKSHDEVATEPTRPAPVQKTAPFKELAGRWVGEGRIGMSEGKNESVKCRATYFVNETGAELKQNIRCASAGGKVE